MRQRRNRFPLDRSRAAALITALAVCGASVGILVDRRRGGPDDDEYVRRVRLELAVFTDWLAANRVRGHIGEIGWPTSHAGDARRYAVLAQRYIDDMREADVRGAVWATGEWWPPDYDLAVYVASSPTKPISSRRPQAEVLEENAGTLAIHVNGGEFGAEYGTTARSRFSNVNRGTYGTDWHYDSRATFDFLASRGLEEVVIPFRWERIQPTLGGPLDAAELVRLREAIGRAAAAGLFAIPSVANYGAYYVHDTALGGGVRRAIGTPQVTVAHFADLWRRLSLALNRVRGIAAYGLMREPAGLPGVSVRDQAMVWERASQAAVGAVRATGDTRLLLVSGYQFSNAYSWPRQHPSLWIVDPARNHAYSAHHYWDSGHQGEYLSYEEERLLSEIDFATDVGLLLRF